MLLNLMVRPNTMDSYQFQRRVSKELSLKSTIFIDTSFLTNEKIISDAKEDAEKYGDEIALWVTALLDMPNSKLWLLSEADKERAIKYSIDKFKEVFGCYPKSVGNFVLDSSCIKMIKDYCPETTTVVAGCFEEGVKVYHGCNNSWYLFSEGMHWNPWYPSKGHSLRPAANDDEWSGVVAVPHLSRDLVQGFEGRNDFFASHSGNVQRGLANIGKDCPYNLNLVDQYRMQADFNEGFAYYQVHCSPGWLSGSVNVIDSDDITQDLYRQKLTYLADLRNNGELEDLTLSQFGERYKNEVPIGQQSVAVAKDLLYGSGKHYCWVFDSNYRVTIDTHQGGSIGDLRPYGAKYDAISGVDDPTGRLLMATYPYIIHSQYRTGTKTHYSDGSKTTLYMTHQGEVLDMCNYRTRVESVVRDSKKTTLTLTPVEIRFQSGLEITVQTVYEFEFSGNIGIIRRVLKSNDSSAEVRFQEYVRACFGFTEYPENLKNIVLTLDNEKVLSYKYAKKSVVKAGAIEAGALIPDIQTKLKLLTEKSATSAEVMDGHLFEPFFTLKLNYDTKAEEKEIKSWLEIKKL